MKKKIAPLVFHFPLLFFLRFFLLKFSFLKIYEGYFCYWVGL